MSIVLPGWTCLTCGAFNGAAMEVRKDCRCCGKPRAPFIKLMFHSLYGVFGQRKKSTLAAKGHP
jgi:hypothetical protein